MDENIETIMADYDSGNITVIEAMDKLQIYCDKQSIGARIDELQRTIAYFDDEGRESKKVLKAFENNRIKALESAPIKDGSRK